MLTIDANTKISALLKQHPDALEAIISISPKFNKLRNPLLRKLMAPRTSISMASKIGGCTVNDFFDKLQPLGFVIDKTVDHKESESSKDIPVFMKTMNPEKVILLDVRQDIEAGKDPLSLIMQKVKPMHAGEILKLVNSFEPVPLMQLLEKQGYESYSEIINENIVYTYFYKTEKAVEKSAEGTKPGDSDNWEEMLAKFKDKTTTIDVRELEMPLPMLTILDNLDKLPEGTALYVFHKRIPVFLLPELRERKFDYRIKEISDAEVHLLIFKL
ncbi:MAG: DUF2249 domain-containing protein [Bacteroidia bacterium]|nr:DUF2249 domain-containing protein [Bacteroidia bacterium]MCZ2248136.1 DUF2249 domain-containing protein [Bacteroidia bacterium]